MKKLLFGFLLLFVTISSFASTFDSCECELVDVVNVNGSGKNAVTAYVGARNFVEKENDEVSVQFIKIGASSSLVDVHYSNAHKRISEMCQKKLAYYVDVDVCPLVEDEGYDEDCDEDSNIDFDEDSNTGFDEELESESRS